VKNTDIKFDYSATSAPDDVVRSVAAEMTGGGLKPLTDDERIERKIWREEQAWLAEQRDMDRRQRQAEQAAEAEAMARHEAALEQAERNRVTRLEHQAQIALDANRRELADLRFQSAQHQAWQRNVDNAARNAIAYRQRETLMSELDALVTPPPPPEPTVVYVEAAEGSDQLGTPDFNPKLWMQKSRPWF
jgi:hypothetical protein